MTSSPYFDSGSGIPQVDGAENFSPRVDVSEPNDKIPLLWIWKTGDDHITIFHDGSGIPLVDEKSILNCELFIRILFKV